MKYFTYHADILRILLLFALSGKFGEIPVGIGLGTVGAHHPYQGEEDDHTKGCDAGQPAQLLGGHSAYHHHTKDSDAEQHGGRQVLDGNEDRKEPGYSEDELQCFLVGSFICLHGTQYLCRGQHYGAFGYLRGLKLNAQ